MRQNCSHSLNYQNVLEVHKSLVLSQTWGEQTAVNQDHKLQEQY